MFYRAKTTSLSPHGRQVHILKDAVQLPFARIIEGWRYSPAFRSFYTETLLAHGGNGCFWEHPRLNKSTVDQAYECVITQTDTFSGRTANFRPFAREMRPGERIGSFPNLSGEALLVVPNQSDEISCNGRDLISFLRTAPEKLMHEFWARVGQETAAAIDAGSPFQFLSTHGLGVLWLHVRLEERGKYYSFKAYSD